MTTTNSLEPITVEELIARLSELPGYLPVQFTDGRRCLSYRGDVDVVVHTSLIDGHNCVDIGFGGLNYSG